MSNNATSNETDLDWLVRNVHKWPCGKHQPWCYVVTKIDGERTWASNVLSSRFPYSRVDKDQWLSRRAELQNKPGWEIHEYKVIAQGRNGSWYGSNYSEEKFGHESLFCITGTGWNCICRGVDLGDWRDTLEKRPEEFKPFTSIEDNQEKDMKQDNGWFERGELPPVGTECIFEPGDGKCYFNESELRAKGQKVTIIAHTKYKKGDGSVAVFQWDLNDCCGVSSANQNGFRPIRTEHEQLTSIIDGGKRVLAEPEAIADAILAAGFSLRAR